MFLIVLLTPLDLAIILAFPTLCFSIRSWIRRIKLRWILICISSFIDCSVAYSGTSHGFSPDMCLKTLGNHQHSILLLSSWGWLQPLRMKTVLVSVQSKLYGTFPTASRARVGVWSDVSSDGPKASSYCRSTDFCYGSRLSNLPYLNGRIKRTPGFSVVFHHIKLGKWLKRIIGFDFASFKFYKFLIHFKVENLYSVPLG